MRARYLLPVSLLSLFAAAAAMAAPTVTAPDTATIGSQISITLSGSTDARDFVTIVPKGSRAGAYDAYTYVGAQGGALKLAMPVIAGDYELRLLGAASPYPTLASRPIRLDDVPASVQAPASVAAGASFEVRWTGPNNERDYVAIGDRIRRAAAISPTCIRAQGSPIKLVAPDQARRL